MIDRKVIEKKIDKYYWDEYPELLEFFIDDFMCWQMMASDYDITRLVNILEANGETVSNMIIALACEGCDGFCGIYGRSYTIQEEYDCLNEFHYFFNSWFDVCRKAVTWDIQVMYTDKREAREDMAEKGYKNLSDFVNGEMDVFKTKDGYVEKIYY